MKEKKGLYPEKSVYTQQIGPGFCFGALALMLRFFFEVCSPMHCYELSRAYVFHLWYVYTLTFLKKSALNVQYVLDLG